MRRGLWFLVPVLLVAVPACRHAQKDGETTKPTPVRLPVQVEVKNNFALPAEIFVVASGTSQRLGTVHPGMRAHYTIPPGLTGNGSVVIEARASSTNQVGRSGPLLLSSGAIVDFQVAEQLFNSTATIRP
ncbi:MAG: hypothetical protein ABI679_07250 [Gemmatimonadota bacterium]